MVSTGSQGIEARWPRRLPIGQSIGFQIIANGRMHFIDSRRLAVGDHLLHHVILVRVQQIGVEQIEIDLDDELMPFAGPSSASSAKKNA